MSICPHQLTHVAVPEQVGNGFPEELLDPLVVARRRSKSFVRATQMVDYDR